ncbi:hypothetical protein [Micromonospora sp. ATA51]|uniref:hypothetical protein n=1 Tax=Micromonospora sp. ATA51 TaxID=2806098 RepID=UPI001A4A9645|nr:hypothetical protein [Micromonospora sp. ATA51]MBM0227980.1 hypothetical protein [Micromonospora sp. ATA51]
MSVTVRAELIEQVPPAELWQVVPLSDVEEGDVVSFDLAALAERRRESVPRVDWTEVFAQALAVRVIEELGGWRQLHTYDLTCSTVGGLPEMEVLRLR